MSWSKAGAREHALEHVLDAGGVPRADVLVEGRCVFEQFDMSVTPECPTSKCGRGRGGGLVGKPLATAVLIVICRP